MSEEEDVRHLRDINKDDTYTFVSDMKNPNTRRKAKKTGRSPLVDIKMIYLNLVNINIVNGTKTISLF